MTIVPIEEAFINFCEGGDGSPCSETNDCLPDVPACYPVSELTDLDFQVLLSVGSSDINLDGLTAGTVTFWIGIARDCDSCDPAADKVAQLHVEQWKTTGVDQYDYFALSTDGWYSGAGYSYDALFDSLTDGDCFRLCLFVKGTVGYPNEYILMGCSPCMIKIEDTCDTSIIRYRNNQTACGFYNNSNPFYTTYYNSIRLPFKLGKPQPKTVKNVYRLSDGNYIKNSSSKAMEWQCDTELMSKEWHRKLDNALDHNQLKITNQNAGFVDGFFMSQEDDNYKIAWEDLPGDYSAAPATFKLMQMPFNEFNSNCNLAPIDPVTGTYVNIIDQDGNVIYQAPAGTDYSVLVFSGIDAGSSSTTYSNSIVAIP